MTKIDEFNRDHSATMRKLQNRIAELEAELSTLKAEHEALVEAVKQNHKAAYAVLRAYDKDRPHLLWGIRQLRKSFGIGEYEPIAHNRDYPVVALTKCGEGEQDER